MSSERLTSLSPAPTLLVIRLSSLGDLILSTAFLESLPEGVRVDWVVAQPFAFLLQGHPKVRRLIPYDKKTGLRGWFRLLSELSKESYSDYVDLHVNLRSFVARLFFAFKGSRFQKLKKERWKTWGYFTFKSKWPLRFRPRPYWQRFAEVAARLQLSEGFQTQVGFSPPRFPLTATAADVQKVLEAYGLEPGRYFVVMPSSRWQSKEWGTRRYFETILALRQSLNPPQVVILGRESDIACQALIQLLGQQGIRAVSLLAEPRFENTALIVSKAMFYLGGDTGLAHLAEAVGTKAFMVFGPTQPDVGFGPWQSTSQSIRSTVGCSPCSKDGRICYRRNDPYACFSSILPAAVAQTIRSASIP